jgi:asparagine synthase (glutamine-hydrolysing)
MTALAGLWDRRRTTTEGAVGRMLDAQAIYGPEMPARRSLGDVTLGRRLYSLLPEDDYDRGPVIGADGSLLLVADARVDNREELAERLGWSAADLARAAEPALLMAVIERWGSEGLAHVVGAFALMIWDQRRQSLVLARDALGERPLHYHRGDGFVAVASMPKGLHALPDIPYAANKATAADFLAVLPEGGDSFFAGIARVPPGHAVTIAPDGITAKRLWRPAAGLMQLKADDYAEGLREQMNRAVASRLRRAGGGVGAHLSGGLDSASVAATAARLLAPDTLHAFTAAPGTATPTPRGTISDEGALAAATARMHPAMAHVVVRGDGASPFALMDRHFDLYQRPVLNPCNAVWSEAIRDAARDRGVRVLLTGQLGNFTISHDGAQRLPQLLRRGNLPALGRLVVQLRRRGWTTRRLGAATVGPFLPPAVWQWITDHFDRPLGLDGYSAIRPEAMVAHDVAGRAEKRHADLTFRPWADSRAMRLWGLDRVDMGTYNKGTLAGWGIDLRDPTADRRLIEWALRVPEEQYILGGEPRSLARRAFADRLPPEVLRERRRGYQGADWHVGVTAARRSIAEELDSFTRCAPAAALIDVARLQATVADWPDALPDDPRWNDAAVADRFRSMLLRGVAAGHFLRRVARTN